MLKDSFDSMLGEAKQRQTHCLPQIERRARTVDLNQIVQMVCSR